MYVKASAKRLKESRYKRWQMSMMKTEKLIKAATEKELIEVSRVRSIRICHCKPSLPVVCFSDGVLEDMSLASRILEDNFYSPWPWPRELCPWPWPRG